MSRWWRLRKESNRGTALFGDQRHGPFLEAALPTLSPHPRNVSPENKCFSDDALGQNYAYVG
jgi:hypothetical protein